MGEGVVLAEYTPHIGQKTLRHITHKPKARPYFTDETFLAFFLRLNKVPPEASSVFFVILPASLHLQTVLVGGNLSTVNLQVRMNHARPGRRHIIPVDIIKIYQGIETGNHFNELQCGIKRISHPFGG